MGEKIRTLAKVSINGCIHEVELNQASSPDKPQQIHVQSRKFRAEFELPEFVELCVALNLAAEKLRHMKNIK